MTDEEMDAAEYKFDTIKINVTCCALPLQMDGHWRDMDFEYRERHGRWELVTNGKTVTRGDSDPYHYEDMPTACSRIADVYRGNTPNGETYDPA